ncbi:MAG: thiamine pyrophosphate-dependent dehydrogenase E1 component subunit alpha [Deltaproteobacteria bacterium]|nr:thiamine pyrophosphate-dependent dehydrogenase E1 component subunit alpha [Deltaproteobacteria bacterium]
MEPIRKGLSTDQLIQFYKKMFLIRSMEEKISEMYYDAKIPGFVHVSIGQEAVAVGVSGNLRKSDLLGSTHRGHGHMLAKGCDLNRFMAEIFGKRTGYCKGKGGSLHLFNLADGFIGTCSIVGGGFPYATGCALALHMQRKDDIVVCFLGDGSTAEGSFHESVNMAAIWDLPVLFVCENNLYGEFTHHKDTSPLPNVADMAANYKIPGKIVDGNDVLAVYHSCSELIEEIRKGSGPALLEAKTYRWHGHYEGEEFLLADRKYRSEEEIEAWKKRDPVKLFKNYLLEKGSVSEEQVKAIETGVFKNIEDAIKFAQDSPLPETTEAYTDVLG